MGFLNYINIRIAEFFFSKRSRQDKDFSASLHTCVEESFTWKISSQFDTFDFTKDKIFLYKLTHIERNRICLEIKKSHYGIWYISWEMQSNDSNPFTINSTYDNIIVDFYLNLTDEEKLAYCDVESLGNLIMDVGDQAMDYNSRLNVIWEFED